MANPCILLGCKNSKEFGTALEQHIQVSRSWYDNDDLLDEIENIYNFLEENKKSIIIFLLKWESRVSRFDVKSLIMILEVFDCTILKRIIFINHSIEKVGYLSNKDRDYTLKIRTSRLQDLSRIFKSKEIYPCENLFITTSFEYSKNEYSKEDFQPFNIDNILNEIVYKFELIKEQVKIIIKFKDCFFSREVKNNKLVYGFVFIFESVSFYFSRVPPDFTRIENTIELGKNIYKKLTER